MIATKTNILSRNGLKVEIDAMQRVRRGFFSLLPSTGLALAMALLGIVCTPNLLAQNLRGQ